MATPTGAEGMDLESLAIESAVQRVADEEIARLMEQTKRLIHLGDDATVYDRRTADLRFHQSIADASGRRILAETLEPLILP